MSSQNDTPPAKPHDYLVAAGSRAGEESVRYTCLVCSTALAQARQGGRWSVGN